MTLFQLYRVNCLSSQRLYSLDCRMHLHIVTAYLSVEKVPRKKPKTWSKRLV